MFYPLANERSRPDRSDYNQMIKEYKNLLLTHKNVRGELAPLIGISPAQISRKGLLDCLKNDGIYTTDAFAEYSEIEKSADLLFTVLMTEEMKVLSQMRLQNLKGRDTGTYPDPITLSVDLEHGHGISTIKEQSQEEIISAIQSLDI